MTQLEAIDILKTGSNVYLTGAAGSGKTFVLQRYIEYLKLQQKKVGITASTGVAATQLNGITINSWAGLGIKQTLSDTEVIDLLKRKYMRRRFKGLKAIIIDEVSMLPAWTLDNVDKICKAFMRSDDPFGGLQVILCGDFFQLPPIGKLQHASSSPQQEKIQFVYRSPVWNELDLKVCYLDRPYRQDDERFLHMLDEIRHNNVTKHTWDLLKERFLQPVDTSLTPTKLYTHNDRADAVNTAELTKIKSERYEYQMRAEGNEMLINTMKKSCLAPERLVLKKGAFVMFVKNNVTEGYVNGTLGKVIDFREEDGYPVVETYAGKHIVAYPAEWEINEDPEMKASISQIPLRLAWAITIHKSQGMSLDAAEIDLGKSFVAGMGYVALSRVRTLRGIRLKSINRTALSVNEEVIRADRRLRELSEQTVAELHDSYWYRKNAQKQLELS